MVDEMKQATATMLAQEPRHKDLSARLVHWTGKALVIIVWISAGIFGLYMLAFYAADWYGNRLENWNKILPGLYQKEKPLATAGIGLHFATGGVILLLGSIQLIEAIRVRYSAFHRWVGRIYVVASLLAAVGGLLFIFIKGTIGGLVMDIGFSLYGVLMLLSAVQTIRYARAGRFDEHRAWALRLYALAIGSWLFRMYHGFWFALTDHYGHTPEFTGGFDKLMAFFFYIPNLLVVELFLRSAKKKATPAFNLLASFVFLLVTVFLMVGTYIFTKMLWGPAIVDWLS